jgi:UDP-N-acetylglucosamine--dolichyl-phosphate N-acetylglucosaminephosphotransferase
VAVPFFGFINFGILYSLALVPLGVTGASNAANMLAGLNGLEAGMGLINVLTIFIVAAVLGEPAVMVLMLAMAGALVAFLRFNWFPAKVFPGDSLTLMTGASIAAAVVIGNMEKVGIMLFALYFVELLLKARTKFQGESFGKIQPDGGLHAPEKIASLTHVVMRLGKGKWNEKQVVLVLLAAQVAVALFALSIFWINLHLVPVTHIRGVI